MKTPTLDDYGQRAHVEARVEALDTRRLRGYAMVFNSRSLDLGGFTEIIDPSAVDRTLKEGIDVRALVNHDQGKVIGRTTAGTLELRKDKRGLAVTIEPDPEISYAGDIMRAVQRGDVSGMSFGFRVLADAWDFTEDNPVRTVTDMRISEVSIVSWPAYEATTVETAVRSWLQARAHRRSLDHLQRIQRQAML
jgi:HK97 family phage prohead protease